MTIAASDVDYDRIDCGSVKSSISSALSVLQEIVEDPDFQGMLRALWNTDEFHRDRFVADVLLNPNEIRERFGVVLPSDVLLQRSSFSDGRPTLFCLCKLLDINAGGWKKVTVTFDNPLT